METCKVCTSPIVTMAFRGTGICGENCRKKAEEDGE